MWAFKLTILTAFIRTVFTAQSAEYGCRSDGSYHIEFVLTPNGETIKSVFGGVPDNPNCQATQGQDGIFRLTVPIDDPNSSLQTDCGVTNQPGTREFALSVTTKSLEAGYKPTDRIYNVQCHFNGPVEMTVTSPMGIQLNSDTSLVVSSNLNPLQSILTFDLASATTGLAVADVSFMESVYLRVRMAENYHNSQSMRVTDCSATGYAAETGMPTGQVAIIGPDGCPDPTNQVISSGFAMLQTDPEVTQTDVFSMFLIQGAASVMFSCKVTLCVDGSCAQSCVPGGRRKRDAENRSEESGEIIAIVRIGHLSEQEAWELNSKSSQERHCANWPYLVAIAALSLVLLVSLGFSMLVFTKKTRDNRVGDFKEKPVA